MKLTNQQLTNLSNHKYSGIDDSLLAYYVLRHYWNYCLNFVPQWIAPNLITLTGTFGILISFFTVAYYSPYLTGELPTWLYLLAAFALFFYQTMDNLDGKQARRTGTSSPLGQLFDHGCDSVVCTLQSLTASSIGSYGCGWLSIYQLFIVTLLPFWLATWEEYHTGTLHLGKFNGPDEGIVLIVLSMVVTAYTGGWVWNATPNQLLPTSIASYIPSDFILNLPMKIIISVFISIPTLITCAVNIRNVIRHLRSKGKPIGPALLHVLCWVIIAGCSFLWYYSSTTLYKSESIWFRYPRTVQLSIGLLFGELVSRLILSHMCHSPFGVFQKSLYPLIIVSLVSTASLFIKLPLSEYIDEKVMLTVFTLVVVMRYFHFVSNTIDQLCRFLKIKCFTIPYNQQQATKDK